MNKFYYSLSILVRTSNSHHHQLHRPFLWYDYVEGDCDQLHSEGDGDDDHSENSKPVMTQLN